MLAGKSAVITGSTSGIGAGIARALAQCGCSVMLNGMGTEEEVNNLRQSIVEETGVKAFYHPADMSKPEQIPELISDAREKLGSVDILVNNAGIQFVSSIEDFPVEKWDAVLAINLSAVFHTTRSVLPQMRRNSWGRIVNIASTHGLVGSPHKSAYVAAKHGVVGLTKVTALETAEQNITCNAICPGWVMTPLVQAQINSLSKQKNISPEEASEALLSEKQPTKRFVEIDQLAALVVFLCSDAAANITGTVIPIDGAWTAR